MNQGPPERVRVTGPARHTANRRARSLDIDDQTPLGTVLMESLLRSQLRLAAVTLLPLVVVALGLPLAFHLWPIVGTWRVVGLPISWLVLGGLIYPLLVLLGWSYTRRAERNEQDFTELLETVESP